MRVAALVLGVLGGVFGLLGAFFALAVGGVSNVAKNNSGNEIVVLGFLAFVFCVLGFAGAGFSLAKPKLAGVLLLVACVGILIAISWGAIVATPLFGLAALFAFLGRKTPQSSEAAPAPVAVS